MKIALLTNEFPPDIYGGAGIHVKFLSRELRALAELEVRKFGTGDESEPGWRVLGIQPSMALSPADPKHNKIYGPLDIGLSMAAGLPQVDVVHCHTWYTHFAGVVASRLQQVPLILTTHSLEPHRPWKAEQLGQGGYDMSCWIEKSAYREADGIIAVSAGMKRDVIDLYGVDPSRVQVIYNGIDPEFYRPTLDESVLRARGIDPSRPFVLFVGRITRQKGIAQLVRAIPQLPPEAQVVLCAGAADTPELEKEVFEEVTRLSTTRGGIVWIGGMMDHEELRVLYSHATVFACPSLYEPFGIINVEAMACGTPVVGSAVGGIPEIITEGETGLLVPLQSRSSTDFEPADPAAFQKALAETLSILLRDPAKARVMGAKARQRAESVFGWKGIASQTLAFYQETIDRRRAATQRT